jgi:hypothetical protein
VKIGGVLLQIANCLNIMEFQIFLDQAKPFKEFLEFSAKLFYGNKFVVSWKI